MRLIVTIILSIFLYSISAQERTIVVNYGKGLDNRIVKSIQNNSNTITSVGTTENYFNNYDQILLTKTTISSGEVLFEEALGENNFDNKPIDLGLDAFGRLLILCEATNEGEKVKNWIAVRDSDGDFIKSVNLSKQISLQAIIFSDSSIKVFYIKNGEIGQLILDLEFNVLSDQLFESDVELNAKRIKIRDYKDHIIILGVDQGSGSSNQIFLLKIIDDRIVKKQFIFDKEFIDIGDITYSEEDKSYYFSTLINGGHSNEDIILYTINEKLDKLGSLQEYELSYRGEDIPVTLRVDSSQVTLYNQSNSHLRGATTYKPQIIELTKEGKPLNKRPNYPKYNNLSEYLIGITDHSGSEILYSSINNGDQFHSDYDFLYRILKTNKLASTGNPEVKFDYKNLDIDIKFNSLGFADQVHQNVLTKANITLKNNSDKVIPYLKFKSDYGIIEWFSIELQQEVKGEQPIGNPEQDFSFEYNMYNQFGKIGGSSKNVTVIIPKPTQVSISNVATDLKEEIVKANSDFKLKLSIKAENIKDNENVSILINSENLINLSNQDITLNRKSKELHEFSVNLKTVENPDSDSLVITIYTYLNDKLISNDFLEFTFEDDSLPIEENPQAKFEIIQINEVHDTVYKKRVNLEYLVLTDKEISMEKVYVIINGKNQVVKNTKMDNIKIKDITKSGSGHRYKIKYSLTLKPGDNTFQLAYNTKETNDDIVSEEIDTYFLNTEYGNLYCISIGVQDTWRGEELRLKYTKEDAITFEKLMKKQEGMFFEKVISTVMVEPEDTNIGDITSTFIDLRKKSEAGIIKKNDVIVLFISTHGVPYKKSHRLTCSNYQVGNERNTTIDFMEDIYNELEAIACNKIYFIDACHSGLINQNMLNKKGISDDDIKYKGALQSLIESNNVSNVLLSCGPTEYSYEHKDWGNSAFIESLESILNDKSLCRRLDVNSDKVLSLSEIRAQFVENTYKIVQKTLGKNEKQTPILVGSEDTVDIPFYAY